MILSGKGSELKNDKAIKGRAKRKLITSKMMLSLVDVAKKGGDDEAVQSYFDSYYCQSKIYVTDGKLFGKYCKNRWCLLCCSIRKADIINRYLPVMETWADPHFITITAKSVPHYNLAKRMRSILNGFRQITEKHRKRAQRGTGMKLVGIKSLECNYNPSTKKYNPHLHIIVANRVMGEMIIKEWLAKCPRHLVSHKAQKIERVWSKEKALIEVVKYGSKIFTEPDVNDKASRKGDRDIYAAALPNIFTAMKGLRIFDRFGFDLPYSRKESNSALYFGCREWTFNSEVFDWINPHTDATLSGYIPTDQLINLVNFHINKEAE